MLSREEEQKIIQSVQTSPKTIQELATILHRNWRTADSYVEKIAQESGLIATKTFRKGTRGALKIVYWSALEKTQSTYQENLTTRILNGSKKEDFSPFDIFQFLEKKDASTKQKTFTLEAQEKIFIFSGNASWIQENKSLQLKKIEELAQKKVSIKILLRIDISSREIVQKLLAINSRVGYDAVTIRHAEQPLRGVLCDNKAELKETLSPEQSRYRELKKAVTIQYSFDGEWALWLEKVFWKIWETSVDAKVRLAALDAIQKE